VRLLPWMNRNMGALIAGATLLLLVGAGIAATRSVPVDDAFRREARLEGPTMDALVALTRSDAKPILVDGERTLLDVSAWDSVLRVNGTEHRLHQLEYNVATDGRETHVTWSFPGYSLTERVTMEDDGAATLQWSFLRGAKAGPQDVSLELGQFAFFLRNASASGHEVRFRLDANDPRFEAPARATDPRDYEVVVAFDRAPASLWFGQGAQGGVDAFHVGFVGADPKPGEPLLLFEEKVRYSRVSTPRPAGNAPAVALPRALERGDAALDAGDLEAVLRVSQPTSKPALLYQGAQVLDVSSLDASLLVNATRVRLADLGRTVEAADRGVAVTWHGEGYRLVENVTLDADAMHVLWSWLRDEASGPQHVELELSHYAQGLANATVARTGFAQDVPAGEGRVAVRASFDPPASAAWTTSGADGADAQRARFTLEDPPAGNLTRIVEETFAVAPGPVEPAALPQEIRARLYFNESARSYALDAGDYRVRISTTNGADKPLLSSPAGRALLEISGWESALSVNGDSRALYHSDVEVVPGDAPCLVWSGPEGKLRECLNVTSADLRIAWSWWRAPGEPAQDVRLRLAHFGGPQSEAGINVTHVDYRLEAGPQESDNRSYFVHGHLSRAPDGFSFAPDAFRLDYALHDPPEGQWTPFFDERFFYDRGSP